jgi:hypothetical protein
MTDELKRVLWKAVVTWSLYYPRISLKGLRKTATNIGPDNLCLAEIRIQHDLLWTPYAIYRFRSRRGKAGPNKRQSVTRESYCPVFGVCVTYKTGFGFDDRLYLTFINLLQHFTKHYFRLDTLDFLPHYTIQLLYLNGQLLLAYCYITSGRTPTRRLPSNGWPVLSCNVVGIT